MLSRNKYTKKNDFRYPTSTQKGPALHIGQALRIKIARRTVVLLLTLAHAKIPIQTYAECVAGTRVVVGRNKAIGIGGRRYCALVVESSHIGNVELQIRENLECTTNTPRCSRERGYAERRCFDSCSSRVRLQERSLRPQERVPA